jgi:hypothetical protein
LEELVLGADADNNVLDAVVSAGLLCWEGPFFFDDLLLFPWEEDILLSILFFFHKGVQVNLAPDVDDDLGVIGEPGGVVVLLVGDVGYGGVLLATPFASPCWAAPSAPSAP